MVNHVQFPGLGLSFTLNRVAFTLFGKDIYWYGILIALGMALAMAFAFHYAREFGVDADRMVDVILVGVVGAIISARAYYVIFAPRPYETLWDMINIRDGGLAIYGTVIAGFLVALIYTRVKKLKLGAMTDLCVMGLILGQCIGRWANFINREAFGGLTDLPWRMRLWTSATQYIEVHPTFFYESLWNLVGLLLMLFVVTRGRRFDGENTWFYFLWYGLGRSWVEGLRTDSLYLFDWTFMGEPIRVSQALSMVMVVVAAGMLFYNLAVKKRSAEDLLVNQMAKAALAAESPETDASLTGSAVEETVESQEKAPASAEQAEKELAAEREEEDDGDAH